MGRLTEKFKDGRNILKKGISDVFCVGFGRFFDGEAIDRLAEYEDLEEQGKLLKLPCAVGDMVYKIYPNDLTDRVLGLTVVAFSNKAMELYGDVWTPFDEIGKTVFLTREEAEAALKEL